MRFLNPVLFGGLLALGLPWLVYRYGRRRNIPRRLFAAISLIEGAEKRDAWWSRIRRSSLLWVRAGTIFSLVMMVVQPTCTGRTSAIKGTLKLPRGDLAIAMILDDTLSMRRRSSAGMQNFTLFKIAQKQAYDLIDTLSPAAQVSFSTVSDRDVSPLRFSRNHRANKEGIMGLRSSYLHAKLHPSLVRALKALGQTRASERHLFLYSDFAAHGISRGDIEALYSLSKGIWMHRIDVSRDKQFLRGNHADMASNAAIAAVRAKILGTPGNRLVRIIAKVCRYQVSGPTSARAGADHEERTIRLFVRGKEVVSSQIRLPKRGCIEKFFHYTVQKRGEYAMRVVLAADELHEDDVRYLQVRVQGPVRVVLVNESPSSLSHQDEFFYLEKALSVSSAGDRPIVFDIARPENLASYHLDAYAVVVLANIDKVSISVKKKLQSFVRAGGGLLITVGDRIDAAEFNRTFSDLLPHSLRGPWTLRPEDRRLRLSGVRRNHRLIRSLTSARAGNDRAQSGLFGLRGARFQTVFRLKSPRGNDPSVLMTYSDGTPALLERSVAAGRVLLFTSSIDRQWSTLPIQPGYLPLIQAMIRYLADDPDARLSRETIAGQPIRLAIDKDVRELRVTGSAGITTPWRSELNDSSIAQNQGYLEVPTLNPGIYRVQSVRIAGALQPEPHLSFAVNTDLRESELAQYEKWPFQSAGLHAEERKRAKQHRSKQQAEQGVRASPASGRERELWHYLGLLCVIFIVGESILARRA